MGIVMKYCNGCNQHCKLGYTISLPNIAPCVGDVTYWEHDVYASGVRRVLFAKFSGTDTDKSRLKRLMVLRAKDIARYCEKQR